MIMPENLSKIVSVNFDFRNAINLYLNLNQVDKVMNYIPTKSSILILKDYLQAILENKEHSTILIGPYGKGKSHLLLVFMAIISLERIDVNNHVIVSLIKRIKEIDEEGQKTARLIEDIWNNKKRFLPVIISNTQSDLNQAFLYALNEALKREKLEDIVPDTYYSLAIKRIRDWKENYPDTYAAFVSSLKKYDKTIDNIYVGLEHCSLEILGIFKKIYPQITAGSEFNPIEVSEVIPLYKSINDTLCSAYEYDGIFIIFDEFSKYIESQNNLNTGNNMKLLQDVCELAADSKNPQMYITMVAHKSIKEYGKNLSSEVINSFTGIEGRISEKYFVTSSKNNYELIQNAIIKDNNLLMEMPYYQRYLGEDIRNQYYELPVFKTNFNIKDFENIILKGCYPLNPISAYILLNISEKVAQNERTLFTFISKDEQYSMARYISDHTSDLPWEIGADLIYDYFGNLFRKDVNNEFIHNEWLNAEYALSKCKSEIQRKIVKVLSVILILNKTEELPANDDTLKLASGIEESIDIILELQSLNIIYKKASTNCYVFKSRAGSDLKKEISRQRELKGGSVNLSKVLDEVSGDYFVLPKKYNNKQYMTRYFRAEHMYYADFCNILDSRLFFEGKGYADGAVIKIFSEAEKIDPDVVKKKLKQFQCTNLVVAVAAKKFDKSKIKRACDYQILQDLKNSMVFDNDNEIIKREIPIMEEDLEKVLTIELESIYDDRKSKIFYFTEGGVVEKQLKYMEQAVGECCSNTYPFTPIINNEIINRQMLTTAQTKKARKTIIEAILSHKNNETFYEGTNQEATIYRSLFVKTRIDKEDEQENIKRVMKVINHFIDSCADMKRCMSELLNVLTNKPFGMRRGVIPLYLSYSVSKRNEDIVIYFGRYEKQLSADIILNMCETPENYYMFVSKEDVSKERYLLRLNELFSVDKKRNLSEARINDILISMQRWYRALPQITRNVTNMADFELAENVSQSIIKVKNVLQAIEANPYEIIFETLPEIFDMAGDYDGTFNCVSDCYHAFMEYYNWMLQKAVSKTYEIFGSKKKNKESLYHILTSWYEEQSDASKQGLYSSQITNFISCIQKLNVYDDGEIVKKIIKAVTDVYFENWNDNSLVVYADELTKVKTEIENIKEQKVIGKAELIFSGKNGNEIRKYYEPVNESDGSILRNMLEDFMEDYEDMSANDRVAILLEIIEKIIG